METYSDEHFKIETEVQAKLKHQPAIRRIEDPDVKIRMYALGEYSIKHRIKDDPEVCKAYWSGWSELRHQGLTDDKIGAIFDAGKQGKLLPK